MKLLTLFLIIYSFILSQDKYPADSLIRSPNISLLNKIGLLPIAGGKGSLTIQIYLTVNFILVVQIMEQMP